VTEEPQMSADEAVARSWKRLRRAHRHRVENPAAKRWDDINDRNHFAEAAAATFKRESQ
jgi:hypothetical protein